MEQQNKTILLVEDEAAIALLEKRWLKDEGFDIIHVSNGQDAIKNIKEKPGLVDLILMDIDLGKGMNGAETAEEILKENDIPLLFLSSHTEKDIISKTRNIASYGYIVKGADETILLASIMMAFRLHNEHLELKSRKELLQKNEERLRFVVEGGKICFWDWDVKAGEIYRNEQLANILGFNFEEIRPLINNGMDLIHPDDREKIRESILNLLNGISSVHRLEYRMNTRAGNYRWIHDRAMVTVRDSDGKPARISGIQVDVTERKRAELQLKQYAEELQSLNNAKDKFFSIISHDLRGPFWGLLGLIRDLKKKSGRLDQSELTEIANVMNNTAEETYKLLTNLLEWSKLQTGRFRFNPCKLNLMTEAEDIISLFSPAASNKSICINNNITEEIHAYVDRNALSIVLRNLIDNAIKFSNDGALIIINSRINENFVEISVEDSGIGMCKEVLEKVFSIDSGITTRGTKGESGSGLGLVLCQDLVRLSGGEISVTSKENKGTKFTFALPAA